MNFQKNKNREGSLSHEPSLLYLRRVVRKKAGNYTPVSLTSILCKCMEHCVKDHIVSYMMRNELFSMQQFGFIKGRSMVLQLLNVMDSWTRALDRGESIDVVYLDFMKVFNTIPHKRLIAKLKSYGTDYYTVVHSKKDPGILVSLCGKDEIKFKFFKILNGYVNIDRNIFSHSRKIIEQEDMR